MTKSRLAVFAGVALLASSTASAEPIIGAFTTPGLADVRIGSDFMDWRQSANELDSGNDNLLFVSATGDFHLLGLTPSTIEDLNTATDSLGATFMLDNFITSTAQPAWDFTWTLEEPSTEMAAGCTAVVYTGCSPLGSPLAIAEAPDVSEPASLLLLGSGLLGAIFLRRRLLRPIAC